MARQGGFEYRLVIAPNKESVYAEHVPSEYTKGALTTFEQIKDIAAGRVDLIDLHRLFDEHPDKQRLYHQNDTHWGDLGGLAAANAIIQSLPSLGVQPISQDEIATESRDGIGDLGNKFDPPETRSQIHAKARHPAAREVYNNGVRNHGNIAVHEKGDGVGPVILVFGDSFAGRAVHWLRERCRRLVRVHTTSLDAEIIAHEKPDAVISINVERFLVRPPVSCESFSVRNDIAEKLAADVAKSASSGGRGAPSFGFYDAMLR